MPVQLNDLIYPEGKLQRSMFPDDDIYENVSVWLQQASAAAAGTTPEGDYDRAVEAYVYFRAYDTIASRIAAQPASQKTMDSSTAWSSSQASYWRQLSLENKAIFDEVAATPIPGSATAASSHSVRKAIVW